MKNSIKFLFFNILLCSAPALQAMSSVRNFGARAFKALTSQQYNHKIYSNAGYKLTTAAAATLAAGCLWGTYDSEAALRLHKHDYDAVIPGNIKILLDSHEKDFAPVLPLSYNRHENRLVYNPRVQKFDWLPGWLVKREHDRIEGAKQFSAAIDELNYSNFIVPEKYRYTSPGGNHYTISKVLETTEKEMTLEELKQLIRIAKKLKWVDPHGGNVAKTSQNKIALIDTKTWYINQEIDQNQDINEYHLNKCILKRLNNSHPLIKSPPLTPEAQDYLNKKIAEIRLADSPCKVLAKIAQKKATRAYKLFFNRLEKHIRTCSAIEN